MLKATIRITLFLVVFTSFAALAETGGTITKLQGDVELFTNPSHSLQGPPPHALFDGEYYSVTKAQTGMIVHDGNILRTAPGAGAKIIFKNGDHMNIGSGTAYRIFVPQKSTILSLLYGRIRSIISKTGPRNGMQVKTTNAAMGVRGTDFLVATGGQENTEVTVLRGTVEVRSLSQEKTILISKGDTGVVSQKKDSKPIEIHRAYQEDLMLINAMSTIKDDKTKIASKEVSKSLDKLEKKAAQTSLQDIKQLDEKTYRDLASRKVQSSERLARITVDQLMAKAPQRKLKPTEEELEQYNKDSYEKYFKRVD